MHVRIGAGVIQNLRWQLLALSAQPVRDRSTLLCRRFAALLLVEHT